MIEIPGFIDLHTHTRYPDNDKFPFIDIDDSAINGGFSTILAMPNSEIPIDSIKNLRIAQEIDKGGLSGKELIPYTSKFVKHIKDSYPDIEVIAGGGIDSLKDNFT